MEESTFVQRERQRNARLGLGVILAGGIVVLAIGILVGSRSTVPNEPQPTPTASATPEITRLLGPVIATEEALRQTAKASGRPIFWLGNIDGTRIEITVNSIGTVYLRYLPLNVEPGSEDPYLLVATYPDDQAVENVGSSTGTDDQSGRLADGTVYSGDGPTGVRMYQATPGIPVQVEVFSPTEGEAFNAVVSGRVVPVRS